MKFFYKSLTIPFLLIYLFTAPSYSEDINVQFEKWLDTFKAYALKNDISQQTLDLTFKNAKYLKNVIKYDRKQPEFFEDTITYVSKRANTLRVSKARKLLKENKKLFLEVENKFHVEKEILLDSLKL